MTYKATIVYPYGRHSELFNTMKEAEEWLDERNNNCENTTIIDTIDESGKIIDGFFYTMEKK